MVLLIGHNIHTSHGFVSSAPFAASLGCTVYQIFLGSPHTYNPKRHLDAELTGLKKGLQTHNLKLVVHANYMLNFCNPVYSFKHKAALTLLINDLNDSVKIGAIGVIIHMGKQLQLDKDTAIDNYVAGLKLVLKKTPKTSTIILETGAGVGTEVCTSIPELGRLRKRFTPEEQKRIKFCIDTCHVYSAGYDLGCKNYVNQVFDQHIQLHLGWSNVVCVHLNDSKCPLNSHKDRHADIGRGYIGEDGLKAFVKLCHNRGVCIVLETPCEGEFCRKTQINLVKKWVS